MIRALAAAAVFHGIPRLLIEDNAEEENKRTLRLGERRRTRIREEIQKSTIQSVSRGWGGNCVDHLNTVEPGEQVVEDDHVAVDGEERQKTCD